MIIRAELHWKNWTIGFYISKARKCLMVYILPFMIEVDFNKY